MRVVCPKCESRYNLPDEKIRPQGTKVRCAQCSHIFRVFKEGAAPEPTPVRLDPSVSSQKPITETKTKKAPEPQTKDKKVELPLQPEVKKDGEKKIEVPSYDIQKEDETKKIAPSPFKQKTKKKEPPAQPEIKTEETRPKILLDIPIQTSEAPIEKKKNS